MQTITPEGIRGLPKHIHAKILTDRDAASSQTITVAVIWSDRTYLTCPGCGQPVSAETPCPVDLNGGEPGGQIREWDKQHHCGQWLAVLWSTCAPTEVTVRNEALVMSARREEALNAERQRILTALTGDLQRALRRLAAPLEDGETPESRQRDVTTGHAAEPGIYHEDGPGGEWVAWEYDPDPDTGDTVDVYASGIAAGQAGSDPQRQATGLPGHCGMCAAYGHAAAHPALGCADVGCDSAHPETRPPQ